MMRLYKQFVRYGDGRIWLVSFLLVLTAALFLFATSPAVQAQDPVLPDTPPDAAAGLEIYAARCANCHGATGNGDGELSGNLPKPPRMFTDPTFRQTAVPAAYYDLITNGNLEAGMPPFGSVSSNPLSDAQVWQAIAAVMTLATPGDVVAQGQAVYEANCLSCHGESGLGDGPDAAAAGAAVPDLTSLDYWFNRSNDVVFASLEPGKLTGHDYELGNTDLQAVVDYARTFSYGYVDSTLANAPIEAATINGVVMNATTGTAVADVPVLLRGFTPDIQQSLALTTTADVNGAYSFDISMVAPDLVYLISVSYDDLSFSSDVGQLSQSETIIDLPVTVYDQTTDPAVVNVAQVHIVLEFLSEETVQVTELYVFENQANAVFVGESGNPDLGTVQLGIPDTAQGVTFERAFSGMDSFIAATEVIQTGDGYADTVPLRPGRSTSSLIANYALAYDKGVEFSHLMPYAVTNATVILPDAGVELTNDGWAEQTQQTMGGMFLSYARQNLPAGSTLTVQLEGEPQEIASTTGSSVAAPRNQTLELAIGGVALAAVLGGAYFVIRGRQTADDEDEYEEEEEDALVGNGRNADELIQLIAELDNAFANGDIDEADYQAQRADLKAELKAIW
ncbi:MAG: c-type cytochrome [Ardenticatenaceae bacterium]|nr:c-type cytochrome [Ardenticatenaceae bacterium]